MIGGPNFCEFVLIRIDGENLESWKALNKAGMDCHVSILSEDQPTVYAALTGDQCTIINIWIKDQTSFIGLSLLLLPKQTLGTL